MEQGEDVYSANLAREVGQKAQLWLSRCTDPRNNMFVSEDAKARWKKRCPKCGVLNPGTPLHCRKCRKYWT